jgi:hypothetical protein
VNSRQPCWLNASAGPRRFLVSRTAICGPSWPTSTQLLLLLL